MINTFKGKVVLITGASSGIGEALARELAKRGANLALLARRLDRIETLAKELQAMGIQAIALQCDVTQEGDLELAVAQTVLRLGKLDGAIANAGFGVSGKVERLKLEDYRRQFETNIFGVLRTAQAAIPELKKTRGFLALVGSVNGYVSVPGGSAYCMSKAAVRTLSECLALELAPKNVTVTHLAPGYVESEIRSVDNFGKATGKDHLSMPAWLIVPAATAARQMVNAIARGKREAVITGHGKFAVALQRHLPQISSALFKKIGVKKLSREESPR